MKGYTINHKTVRKLMSQMGLTCQIRIKRYKSYKGTVGKIAKNVLKRNFSVDTPNKKWVTDVTEFKIKGRKIYLSPILDLFNGWYNNKRIKLKLNGLSPVEYRKQSIK
ncbi:hypothetical protein EfmJHP9_19050 [Enterococcus faecium]|nr:hypothetical protein EfmJHP9_19050 [Enterococcus faecium]